jgi:VanZ family protein
MAFKLTLKVCSVAVLALIVIAALGPGKLVPRSGLGWQIDHVVGYFGVTLMFCLTWQRPRIIGESLIGFAFLLEGLQTFTPDRHADLHAALYSGGGVLAGALSADLFIRRARGCRPRGRSQWRSLLGCLGQLGIRRGPRWSRPLVALASLGLL